MILMSLLCFIRVLNVNMKDVVDLIAVFFFEICSEFVFLEFEFIFKVLWFEGGGGSGKLEGGECGCGM